MEKRLSYVTAAPSWFVFPLKIEDIPNKSIAELLTNSANNWPEKNALICLGRNMSYGELDDLSDRLAFGLINNFNLSKGDRVAMMMPNCIQHTLSYFGINKAGAVAAPVNVMYRERELEYQLNDSGSETIIALDSFYPLIQKVRDSTPLKNIILTNLKDFTSPDAHIPPIFATEKTRPEGTYDLVKFLEEAASTVPEIEIDADRDLSLLLYTAGTTGLPKGVMEAHKLCWAAALSLVSADGITEKDVDLQIMPMFHTSGYNLVRERKQ